MATTRAPGIPIVGCSDWARSIRQGIQQLADFQSHVLITGPSGTGKELIACAIHETSRRAAGPYIPVDCAALSGDLFAGHLFGHVQGAFTGASHERLGCFRAADGGTLFLDEIGELSFEHQSKLLRTIQELAVVPLGCERAVPTDVRILAATNRNLSEEVRCGRFRLDLYYRLNVVSLETLPLSQRPDDIDALANHILEKLATDRGYPRKRLSAAALAALRSYPWPGNVRQLQNLLERAVVFATADVLDEAALTPETPPRVSGPHFSADVPPPSRARQAWPTLAELERDHIRATLEHTAYNQSAAADLLNIDRTSLHRKIRRYQLSLPDWRRRGLRKPR